MRYKQVFQLKKIKLSIKRKEINYVITLKKLKSKLLFLILTKFEKQQFIKDYLDDLLRKK